MVSYYLLLTFAGSCWNGDMFREANFVHSGMLYLIVYSVYSGLVKLCDVILFAWCSFSFLEFPNDWLQRIFLIRFPCVHFYCYIYFGVKLLSVKKPWASPFIGFLSSWYMEQYGILKPYNWLLEFFI